MEPESTPKPPATEIVQEIIEEAPAKIDYHQESLNAYVLNYDLQIPAPYCGFRAQQVWDPEFQVYNSVFAHNCDNYGVKATVYLRPQDY